MTFTSSTDSRAKGMIASSRAAISTMRWTFQGTSFRTPPPRALLRGPSLGLNMRPWEGRSSAQTSWGLSVEHDLWKKASKPRGLQQIGSSSLPVSPRQLLISGILLTSGTAPVTPGRIWHSVTAMLLLGVRPESAHSDGSDSVEEIPASAAGRSPRTHMRCW